MGIPLEIPRHKLGYNLFHNYIVMPYRDVIVVTNTATRRTNKAKSIVMY